MEPRCIWEILENGKKNFVTLCFCVGGLNSNLWLMGGELGMAWPNATISIFITPTSCAYDILDLPQHAKSPFSFFLYCCLSVGGNDSVATPLPALPPSISLGSKATLPWHPAWVLSVHQSARLWDWGQSKSAKANVKRLWHYITWQRSSSECTKMILSTYLGTRGAVAQLSNILLMVSALSIWWCRGLQSAFYDWQVLQLQPVDHSIF